ncbi:DUF7529 family protein [Halorussus halobius]|uniref:DUF7529 family protein n=1 Tax=Halorussus halobius TaxID=1710537 RepID=UPI001FCE529F|nr:hypothetical protein [Halorussus halobius]
MNHESFNRATKALVRWEEMTEEVEALTREYEESGWETLVLSPGDVAPMPADGDRGPAFGLVVPDSELDALAELVGERDDAYDEFEVHAAAVEALAMFAVVVKATALERAICYPVYYDPAVDLEFVEDVRESDTIYTNITNLRESRRFSFRHEKPTLFLQ